MTKEMQLLTAAIEKQITAVFNEGSISAMYEVYAVGTPDETWIATVIMREMHNDKVAVYEHHIANDEDPMDFHRIDHKDDGWRPMFEIKLSDDEWTAIINARPENDASQCASQPQEGDDGQPSPAWQLLEVANDDLADDLIEHYKLGSEIVDFTAEYILDLIAKRGGDA
jgi:hypothetical protein